MNLGFRFTAADGTTEDRIGTCTLTTVRLERRPHALSFASVSRDDDGDGPLPHVFRAAAIFRYFLGVFLFKRPILSTGRSSITSVLHQWIIDHALFQPTGHMNTKTYKEGTNIKTTL